jgi:hypothetical protein
MEFHLYAEIMTNISDGTVLVMKNELDIIYANSKFEETFG